MQLEQLHIRGKKSGVKGKAAHRVLELNDFLRAGYGAAYL
jgi:hypothetical protein